MALAQFDLPIDHVELRVRGNKLLPIAQRLNKIFDA
jgi:hypothetical protein